MSIEENFAILDSVAIEFSNLRLINVNVDGLIKSTHKLEDLQTFENFMDTYYIEAEGAICSFKDMKVLPGWKNEYRYNLNTKYIQMCKSCKHKSKSGCCDEYGITNRSQKMMVIGYYPK